MGLLKKKSRESRVESNGPPYHDSRDAQPDEITQTVVRKCVDYGISSNTAEISPLFALYRNWIDSSGAAKRSEVLQSLTSSIERHCGSAILALVPFIIAETETQIISTAALNLCVLYPAKDDPLVGPRFLSCVLAQSLAPDSATGAALGGMMLLGDERVSGLIRQIWEKWPPEARQEAARQLSPLVSKAHVDLLLEFLAIESDLDTYGCIAAALANLAVGADRDGVLEVERAFPAWSSPDEPLKINRHWSRDEFAKEIRSRLDELVETEPTGPDKGMIMPLVLRRWQGDLN
ncbi:MAG: hypothetical protein C5B58_15390 [Acidobacteria bacterium]|nr:MAG: hypothetical protein C5B58_15390 [Acidobacteriota bacterium]